MKVKFLNLLTLAILIVVFNSCTSCTKTSGITEEEFTFTPMSSEMVKSNTKGLNAFITETLENNPSCNPIPTIEEVKLGQWTYKDKFYSLSQAYKLGIPVVKTDFSKNITVFVRDYSRIEPCIASTGETINYGQVIRTVIEIENFDASAGVDLAAIAASGTIGGKKQSFYLYKDGFFNPKIDKIISSVSGKVFDVENYALYQNVMTQLIELLSEKETKLSVKKIEVIQKVNDNTFLEEAPIIAYTLAMVSKGKNCNDVKSKFNSNPRALELVQKTFGALEIKCETKDISEESKLKAKRLLQGIKIRG